MMSKYKIIHLIQNIIERASNDFTGLGLVIYEDLTHLPIESMSYDCNLDKCINCIELIVEKLISISQDDCKCHDGFHLLNKDLILTHISYYFSTSISDVIKPKFNLGSRYRTAFYGSLLNSVNCTITINSKLVAMIFINGNEYTLDEYRESQV